jgi:hypothetical protein
VFHKVCVFYTFNSGFSASLTGQVSRERGHLGGRSRSVDGLVLDLEHVGGGYFGLGLKLDGWAMVEVGGGGGGFLRREN